MSEAHKKAVEAAIATLNKEAGVTAAEMTGAIAAYIKARDAILCGVEPAAHLRMATVTWITGETVPAPVMSEEEHHAAFPVYRSIED